MPRIAHSADIHLRSLSRHDEARTVLADMNRQLIERKVDHLILAGDLYHTKVSGISPEVIELFSWWFNEIAKICELHIILGNHDGLLTNLSRQDAISPIVAAINNPRIHLYKKSGVYPIEPGFNWCIFSIFDEEGWKNVAPVDGATNIAVFHGPVWGARTESEWRIESDMTSDWFKDYDIALLGDIHKFQYLDYRDYEDGRKPWIAYPGPPIQQGYADDFEHGFLLWDIERGNHNVEFCPLPNPRPYVTLDWRGSVDETLRDLILPVGCRARIKSQDELSQVDVQRMNLRLKEVGACEVTFKSNVQKRSDFVVSTDRRMLQRSDLRNVANLVELIKEYHGASAETTDWSTIASLVSGYLTNSYLADETLRNVNWSLKRLEFDNTFGYGEGNTIDVSKQSGIIGVFGSNRMGKSSIVGSLLYALYNATDRGSLKNLYVVNTRKDHCKTKALIDVAGTEYVIERQTTKVATKRGTAAPTHLNVFRREANGTLTDLVGEDRKDTERVVKRLIGTVDDFTLTSLSAQRSLEQFIDHGSSRRRIYLSRFLDLDIFGRMYDLANRDANNIRSQLKTYSSVDDSKIDVLKGEILALDREIQSLVEDKTSLTIRLNDLRDRVAAAMALSIVTPAQVSSQAVKVSAATKLFEKRRSDLSVVEKNLAELQLKKDKLESILTSYDVAGLRSKRDAAIGLQRQVESAKAKLGVSQAALKQAERSLQILDDVPCGDAFPTCKFIKDAHAVKPTLASLREAVVVSSNAVNELEAAHDALNLDEIGDQLDKLERLQKEVTNLTASMVRVTSERLVLEHQVEAAHVEQLSAKQTLDDLNARLEQSENTELAADKAELQAVTTRLDELDVRKIELASRRGRVQSTLERLETDTSSRNELNSRLNMLDLICSAFSKKGLPQRLLDERLPMINNEIAKILNGIFDFNVELVVDSDTEDLEVFLNYGDSERIIELGSGMEKMIASLAIRVALTNVSTLPKSDMLIIDEGFGALDASGVEACSRLLRFLKQRFRLIMFVTHVDGLKDAADHIIDVVKIEKDARVVYC